MDKQIDEKKIQKELISFIDDELLEDFIDLYSKYSSLLKSFEHVELLLRSCRFGLLSFVEYILNSKFININCSHPSTGYSPLFISIRVQKHNIIKYIIEQTEVNMNWTCDKNGVTCLDEAIRQWDHSTVRLLLEHNSIINHRHLFTVIIESFRQIDKKMFPLVILDELIAHSPKLLDEIGRKRLIELVINRSCYPSTTSTSLLIPLLQRFSSHDSLDLIENLSSNSIEQCQNRCGNIHRTQVAIIGCGPAGLMLGALLSRAGIDSIIIEQQSHSRVETNIRAGVLEQSTIDLLDEVGSNERLFREGIIQRALQIQFNGQRIYLPTTELTEGKVFACYGQHYVLQDLIQLRLKTNQRLWFDIENVHIEQHDQTDDGQRPLIKFHRRNNQEEEFIECDFIAGCDGGSSPCCRKSIPKDQIHTIENTYPYAWLSILAEAPANGNELIYSFDQIHGFALQSLRSTAKGRYHLQVPLVDKLDDWSDERIWSELEKRLTPTDSSWKLIKGPISQRALFPLRSSITIPIQYKRLFLVGDAAHIVPPTAAKGLNVALKDAHILAEGLIDYYENNKLDKLNSYTNACLPHILKAKEFASFMTLLLHKLNLSDDNNQTNEFETIQQKARQQQLQRSHTFQCYVAQSYVN